MEAKNSLILLQKIIISGKYYTDACLLEDVCVICINKITKKTKFIPFKVMYNNNNKFWLQNELWEYFISGDDLAGIEERVVKLNYQWEQPVVTETGPVTAEAANNMADQGFGAEYADFAAMPEYERSRHMKENKKRLDALITQKPRQEQLITEALVETTREAILYNYASLMNVMNIAGDEAKIQTHDMTAHTNELVKASSQLISANVFNDDLMNILVSKSNGTIIQHMTRVYLKGLAFLSYYNKLVSGSSIINKLRISFNEKYHDFYHSLLPHLHTDDIILERVFLGGMRAIPENIFLNWAVGFLLHDIGKAAAIEYHEGEAAYNREIVMEHVKVGYISITNRTNYPKDAGLITGYHHEYYGDPSGYGYFRTCYDQYKKINPHTKLDSCITYDLNAMMNYEALAFFPAKILEIVDVFDSLTDPNRKYRKVITTEEAIGVMREDFINKNRKLDIILFDLFLKFMNEIPTP
jgi:HD-GYP domain-containing protein (c-di-GMP phosphodiesterase class II)